MYLSIKGMWYIIIIYHTDENQNFSKTMCNKTEFQMLEAYEKNKIRMKTAGLGTNNHVLENIISKEYKAAIKENGATHKLVPPGEYRRSISDKSIKTYKDYFVIVLAGLHD